MATTTSPALSLEETKESLVTDSAGSDYFSLAYMQLCGLSYWPTHRQIPAMVADPANVAPWGDGRWTCIWGPAVDWDNANLVYVAAYYDRPTGLPVAAVVVVRGTDLTDDVWGDLKEAFEDLEVPFQYEPPWLRGSQALVAGGTLDALTTIEGLASPSWAPAPGQRLRPFLAGFLANPANQVPVLVVTGHSLGGCVASVLAPWLRSALAAAGVVSPMVPATFAAPTAGNAGYADYLNGTYQYAPRYYNTLDVVPCAWADIPRIKKIYDDFGLGTPELVKLTFDGFEGAMEVTGASYAQPAGRGPLAGTFCFNFTWYQEISTQHDHRNYIAMVGGGNPTCYSDTRPRNRHYDPARRAEVLAAAAEGAEVPAAEIIEMPNPAC